MKKTGLRAARRVSVAEAKSGLSALLRAVETQPVVIQKHGRDVACLVPIPQAEELTSPSPFRGFLSRIQALRHSTGVSGVELEVKRLSLKPRNPFGDE